MPPGITVILECGAYKVYVKSNFLIAKSNVFFRLQSELPSIYRIQSRVDESSFQSFVLFLCGSEIVITDQTWSGLLLLASELECPALAERLHEYMPCFSTPPVIATFMRSANIDDSFTFICNGERFQTHLVNAVCLSPFVAHQLSVDSTARTFTVSHGDIEMDAFGALIGLFAGEVIGNSTSLRKSLMLISRCLGNSELFAWLSILSKADYLRFDDVFTEKRPVTLSKIRLLSFDCLDHILANHALEIANEDALLKLLVDLGPKARPLLRYLHFGFLSDEGFCTLRSVLAPRIPGEAIWVKAIFRLCPLRLESRIITELPRAFALFNGKRSQLLWRGTRDGFRAADFHAKCDGHQNTLTIVRDDKGNIFGGFTPLAWESRIAKGQERNCDKTDPHQQSFIFTIVNPHQFVPRIFPLKKDQDVCAISCDASCGPDFGGGSDLVIVDQANQSRYSYTGDFGRCYVNTTNKQGYRVLTGGARFCVNEIEVFEIFAGI
jgi:hypothetical protein